MIEAELSQMSVKELRALMARVDEAIRAQIAKQRIEKEGPQREAPGRVPTFDLEAERDAWKARRI